MTKKEANLKSNAHAIEETLGVQDRTKEALRRIQQQAAQTEDLGVETMHQLREQRLQTEQIELAAVRVDDGLDKATRLQNRLDRWAGRWGGSAKRAAKKQVKRQVELEREQERIDKQKLSAARSSAAARSAAAAISGSTDRPVTPTRTNTTGAPPSSFTPPKKSKLLKKRPPKKSVVDSNQLHLDKTLDAETKQGLEKVAAEDDAIDSMLDQTALSLDRLKNLSVAIGEETEQQNQKLDSLTGKMEASGEKQRVVNNRIKRFMGGHWRKDPAEQKTLDEKIPLPSTGYM